MTITNSARKYITIGIIFLVIIGLVVASIMGKKQNQMFEADQAVYMLMVQQMQESKYNDVLTTGDMLNDSQNSSELVSYLKALAAINKGEIEQATLNMQRALDINPHKVEDSMFMLQYAEILVEADKKDEALHVLERCEVLPAPASYPEFNERILQLREQIGTTQM